MATDHMTLWQSYSRGLENQKIDALLRGACGAAFQWVGMAQTTLKRVDFLKILLY